jgi:hypothetical protein
LVLTFLRIKIMQDGRTAEIVMKYNTKSIFKRWCVHIRHARTGAQAFWEQHATQGRTSSALVLHLRCKYCRVCDFDFFWHPSVCKYVLVVSFCSMRASLHSVFVSSQVGDVDALESVMWMRYRFAIRGEKKLFRATRSYHVSGSAN